MKLPHIFEKRDDGFTISSDKAYLDIETIYEFLKNDSYWGNELTPELTKRQMEHSPLCYGVFNGDPSKGENSEMVGFARVITDFVRFSWLTDVFILPEHRGSGLSKWLIGVIVSHPYLKGTSFNLMTEDAHTLYEQFGFKPVDQPKNRLYRPLNWDDVYKGHGLR